MVGKETPHAAMQDIFVPRMQEARDGLDTPITTMFLFPGHARASHAPSPPHARQQRQSRHRQVEAPTTSSAPAPPAPVLQILPVPPPNIAAAASSAASSSSAATTMATALTPEVVAQLMAAGHFVREDGE